MLKGGRYSAPQGRVGRRFVDTLAREFEGVEERRWNSERPLVFAAVILQSTPEVKKSKDIRARLEHRMDLWDKRKFATLVTDTVQTARSNVATRREPTEESKARSFNATLISGRLRQAVSKLTDRGGGGVLMPDDIDSKSGRPVLDVLKDKHPPMREPGVAAMPSYEELPDHVRLLINEEMVAEVAGKLSGSAGPGGTDAVDLQKWLLTFGSASERLRAVLARITMWLANGSPSWAAYR